jgi:hypothetical protein
MSMVGYVLGYDYTGPENYLSPNVQTTAGLVIDTVKIFCLRRVLAVFYMLISIVFLTR